MCGIVGIIGKNVVPDILDGLKRLEYRGYDSAGIATIVGHKIDRRRAEGKLKNLAVRLQSEPLKGDIGIGHTRWATHGAPSENNAHPHATDKVALVHNGIIENYQQLKEELSEQGYKFVTETDTEVIAHLLTACLDNGETPEQAMKSAVGKLQGAYAMAVLFNTAPDKLFGARRGSPLVVGYGENEMYLGSDALALAGLTNTISHIEEEHYIVLTRNDVNAYKRDGTHVPLVKENSYVTGGNTGKAGYRHYMLKEIFEQPTVIGDTLHALINPTRHKVQLPFEMPRPKAITIVGCGTSGHAALVGQYLIEQYAKIPVRVDIGSEYRYRQPVEHKGTLLVVISQSGETADTIAAMRYAKQAAIPVMAIVNVPSSTMAREADYVLPTLAGPEISVAATKAFTTQLAALAAFALSLSTNIKIPLQELCTIPAYCNQVLHLSDQILKVASELTDVTSLLYSGRHIHYPIALEGALKMKECSYVHAEGFAAGEFKHGHIALIDEHTPNVAIAPSGELFEKVASNIREVAARGGKVLVIGDKKAVKALEDCSWRSITVPNAPEIAQPALYAVVVQFLAYHIAVLKGTDVDQPRNLAKSVTVE